ncbi:MULTISPECIES: VC0807 family protein [Roseateles]|uniref:MFS transporter n=1 Tax=Roseateles albus TaxID=2987525 RepID=A0ABT5KF29_9BURK|nr:MULTISPECIES: VC0807 family protein [Roseateles]MCV2358225.1 MFS transporter [Paucibacter sp. TC2R-5]MDC8772528.1 MFS transporter [Roseateles albus]
MSAKPASAPTPAARPGNTMAELLIAVLLPSLVLMWTSNPERLGNVGALLLALAFPLAWAAYSGLRERRFSWMAALGVASTLLTGGIALLALDTRWLAIKEAAVPGVIAIAILLSMLGKKPLVRLMVFNPAIMNVPHIEAALAERGATAAFERRLKLGTLMLAGSFAFSSVMNYVLAVWIVHSPAGSEQFNTELGRMNLLSWPMIAIPSMLLTMGVLFYLARGIRQMTGLTLEECLHPQ